MSIPAIIPVNRLDRAKGRLDGLLSEDERRALMLATLGRVIAAAREAGFEPQLLTADPDAGRAFAGKAGVIAERPEVSGLNAQLEAAMAGLEEVLILHADLPLVTARDLERLKNEAADGPSVALSRSRDGGTNAMLLRPPGRFPLAYGRESWQQHHDAAIAAEMRVVRVDSPTLELDLDTADDLKAFFARDGWESSEAGRLFVEWGFPGRLGTIGEGRRR